MSIFLIVQPYKLCAILLKDENLLYRYI